SHSHCELFQQGEMLVVRDLDSKNGVFMHGVRVREAAVLPGDCLTLGRTEITLRYRRPIADEGSSANSAASIPAARRPNTGARRRKNYCIESSLPADAPLTTPADRPATVL